MSKQGTLPRTDKTDSELSGNNTDESEGMISKEKYLELANHYERVKDLNVQLIEKVEKMNRDITRMAVQLAKVQKETDRTENNPTESNLDEDVDRIKPKNEVLDQSSEIVDRLSILERRIPIKYPRIDNYYMGK